MNRETLAGGWIEYREPEEVIEKKRRRITVMAPRASNISNRLNNDEVVEVGDMEFLLEFNDAIAICLVNAWSYDAEVTAEGLLDLPAPAYDSVIRHGQANIKRLLPDFAVDPDPKVITEN